MNNSLIDSSFIQSSLWNDVGTISKFETLCLATPLFIWGMGMTESAIKVLYRASVVAFKTIAGKDSSQERCLLVHQWSLTKGCGALGSIASIPLGLKLIPLDFFFIVRVPISAFTLEKTCQPLIQQAKTYKNLEKKIKKAKKRLEGQIQESQPAEIDAYERDLKANIFDQSYTFKATFRATEIAIKLAKKIFFSERLLNGLKFFLNSIEDEICYSSDRPSIQSIFKS